jgi:hypothetical protein
MREAVSSIFLERGVQRIVYVPSLHQYWRPLEAEPPYWCRGMDMNHHLQPNDD